MTVKHALSQTTGFGDHGCRGQISYEKCAKLVYTEAFAKFETGAQYTSPDGAVFNPVFTTAMFGATDLGITTAKPGQYFFYRTGCWEFVGALIEKVSGKSYENVIHQYLVEPLGIGDDVLKVSSLHSSPGLT